MLDFGASWDTLAITSRIGTGNWAFVITRNNQEVILGGVISKSALREALLDNNPATAFNPFLGFFGRNSPAAISSVYVTLHNSGVFELPLGYFTINGDLFKSSRWAGLFCPRTRVSWGALEERS